MVHLEIKGTSRNGENVEYFTTEARTGGFSFSNFLPNLAGCLMFIDVVMWNGATSHKAILSSVVVIMLAHHTRG